MNRSAENVNKYVVMSLIIVIILVGVGFIVLTVTTQKISTNNSIKPHPTRSQESKEEEITNKLLLNTKALTGWSTNIQSTIQLQEKLLKVPALYVGDIDDFFLRKGKTYMKMESSFYDYDNLSYILELECDQAHLKSFKQQNTGVDIRSKIGSKVAVVAILDEIAKATISLSSEIDGDSTYLEYSKPFPDLYVGKGTCIDLAYLGEGGY